MCNWCLVKTNLFNELFIEQCRRIANDSSFPNNQTTETVARISGINIDTDIIIKLIATVDPNKAHGWDGMSICMLKLCAIVISNPPRIFLITT